MRTFLAILALVLSLNNAISQKLTSKTGEISFDGSVPSFEPVKAKSNSVTCVFNSNNGQLASLVLIKSFSFKMALMEEHFNENYIESNKFPKAIFKGKLENFDEKELSDKPKSYNLTGSIELHGVKKNINAKIFINKENNGIKIDSDFILNASAFDISIPSFVRSKLSDVVKVNVNFLVK